MAAKLILSIDGMVINEYALKKERMTIGRRAHNDIVIDNLAVSGEHASVVTIMNDSFLEDLGSTNGLLVNGVQTKKHFLQSNDVIEIGKYKLKYVNEMAGQASQAASATDFDKTMVLRAPFKPTAVEKSDTFAENVRATPTAPAATIDKALQTGRFEAPHQAVIPMATTPAPAAQPVQPAAAVPRAVAVQILTGPNAGKELDLVKNLTTLGKPGQVAVITRRPQGYFITHVEGDSYPVVNGTVLGGQPHQLKDHDVIELAGVKMEFYYKT